MNHTITTLLLTLAGLTVTAPTVVAQQRRGGGHVVRTGTGLTHHSFPPQRLVVISPATMSYSTPYSLPLAATPAPTLTSPATPDFIGDQDDPPALATPQVVRQLFVKNDSGRSLTIYLQYRTRTDQGNWRWYPADPRVSTEALAFDVGPGQHTALEDDRWLISASQVRLWAVADSGEEWNDHRSQSLWLVPELDDGGRHAYVAPTVQPFTHTFSR